MQERLYFSREVATAAGLPYATLMRWLHAGLLRRRPEQRAGRGSAMLWTERDLQEARIAAGLRDFISRAEGPLYEIMLAVQELEALPIEPALHLDATGRPVVVEYVPTSDDLRLYAEAAVRRTWVSRTTPRQRWLDQEEIEAMDRQEKDIAVRPEDHTLDLFA